MEKSPTFIANFANDDQPKVMQVIAVTGPNFYTNSTAHDVYGDEIPHGFSVWSLDGNTTEFWATYAIMFPDDDSIDQTLAKWNL